jgi:predicted MPP superfamily phosphohydrolase
MFLIPCVILAELLCWWWADLRIRHMSHARPWRALLAVFIASQAAYAICFLVVTSWFRSSRNFVPLPFHVSVYLWHLMVLPACCVFIGTKIVADWVRKLKRNSNSHHETPLGLNGAPTFSRRHLLGAAIVAIPPVVTAGLSRATLNQLGQFRIRQVELRIPGLPSDLHGLTIAQISDIHIGKLTRPGMAEHVADAANAMGAELMIFSGDLIDYSLDDLLAGIDFIRRLKPRLGPDYLVMIEGNHDLLEDGVSFERMARAAALPILIDEARTIRVPGRQTPVQLLGLRWGVPVGDAHERMRMDDPAILASMQRVLPMRETGAFPILLTHHPHAFDPAAGAGLPLTLAGHTHGGQIMLTDHIGAGPLRFRYWTGLYRKGDSQLFVNNGVGNWFPLRFNAPAEIVKLTLFRAWR